MTQTSRRRTLLGLTITAVAALFPSLVRATGAASAKRVALPKFSAALPGGELPAGWIHQTLPGVEHANRFDLWTDEGRTVMRVRSERSASTLATVQRFDPAATPLLKWRWRVSNAVVGSNLLIKGGDDYAARLYVLFDLPSERLSFGDRLKISTARLLHGAEIPTAALCYVWGNTQLAGKSGWNPYTDRVRMIVVDSGSEHAGQWREQVRDVLADFRAAFGDPVPPVSGLAIGADTDNTGERVETFFGDIAFEARA